MNISGLLRSFIGEPQASDAKTLELKVGQIVKGVILQLLSDQDALINIGGVQVRARLETPMKQGEPTLLQVQPESVNGQPVLKPLHESQTQIADASMPTLLKELGLKDDAQNRQFIRTMQQEAVPLTKETTAAFAEVLQAKPAKADAQDWLQTAALVWKRGLPVSPETVNALRSVLGGPPMFELLQQLETESEAALRDTELPDGLRRQLNGLTAALREAVDGAVAAADAGGDAGLPAAAAQQPRQAAAAPSAAPGGGEPPARASVAPPAPLAGRTAPAEAAPGPAAAQQQAPAPVAAASPAAQGPATQETASQAAKAPAAAPGAGEPQADHWIGRMLKALGVEYERDILLRGKDDPLQRKLLPELSAPTAQDTGAPSADTTAKSATDTIKGQLLQLLSSDELPAGLKETMQQAVQQITGQQLLMTPDRTAPFAHVTLFVPFRDEKGQQTASVHIQSRRGSRGELDADNCRLMFDLSMNQMGNTLLDVQVVDRVVSLNVHNDHPAVQLLVDQHRDELAGGLQQTGYQLLSLKFSPYPVPSDWAGQDQPDAAGIDAGKPLQQLKSLVQTKPYKGVDIRV